LSEKARKTPGLFFEDRTSDKGGGFVGEKD